MNNYVVYVANVGVEYRGTDGKAALREYSECVKLSREGYGMWGRQSVMLYCNDEIIAEHAGEFEDENE